MRPYPPATVTKLGALSWALLLAACGGKEHPPALGDTTVPKHDGGVTMIVPGVDGGDNGGSSDPAAAEIMKYCTEVPPYEFMLCFGTQEGHPAYVAPPTVPLARNWDLRNRILGQFRIDADHRVFDADATRSPYEVYLKVAAPMGQELVPGTYSTDDGAEIDFEWVMRYTCPDGIQTGKFTVYALTWDAMNIPTQAEIDFWQHCGDMTTPVLSGRFRLNSSRPP